MLRRTLLAVLAFTGLIIFANRADANPLPPGTLVGSTPPDHPISLAGDTFVTSTSGAFAGLPNGVPNGTYTAWVYRTPGGTLDFAYQFHVLGGTVESTSHSNFSGTTIYDAGYEAPAAGQVAPFTMSRDASGAQAKFYFAGVTAGQTSTIDVLRTTATTYTIGTYTFQDGGAIGVPAFQPIPEPSSMVLVGLGAMGLVTYGLRRRKVAQGA
jgi:hypothetical protein